MADSVEYNDERLRVIYDRMIDAGIDADEVSRLMKPLQDEFERRVCGLVWSHKTATQKMIQDMGQRLPLLTPSLDESIIQDENGRDHILVEGDNLYLLMAMQYTHIRNGHGMVDVIYIDPPYNTGSVTFDYNDRFEKSEWLSMMDVRLRLARNVMADNGVMFVQIDDGYQPELRMLMDDIFGSNNFVNCICVKTSEPTGVKMAHVTKRLPKLHEYVLLYRKTSGVRLKDIRVPKDKWDSEYRIYLDGLTKAEFDELKSIRDDECRNDDDIARADEILSKIRAISLEDAYRRDRIVSSQEKSQYNLRNSFRIARIASLSGGAKQFADFKRNTTTADFFSIVTRQKKMYFIRNGYSFDVSKPRVKVLFADDYLTYNPCDFWMDIRTTGLDSEGGVSFTNGKKPLRLIKRILDLSNKPDAIVLDFFAGSGTTMQAVLELNAEDGGHRQCILGTNNELGEDAVRKAKKNGWVEGSPEWASFGVCQAVTLKRMENVFPSHEHDNLRFYRISESEMVDSSIDNGGDITRMRMAQHAVPYISLREEAYADEAHDDESYHMLMSPTKHVMVVTDVNMLTTDIEALAEAQGIDGLIVYCPIRKSYDKSTVHYREYPREIIDALRHHQARARQVTR